MDSNGCVNIYACTWKTTVTYTCTYKHPLALVFIHKPTLLSVHTSAGLSAEVQASAYVTHNSSSEWRQLYCGVLRHNGRNTTVTDCRGRLYCVVLRYHDRNTTSLTAIVDCDNTTFVQIELFANNTAIIIYSLTQTSNLSNRNSNGCLVAKWVFAIWS